MMMMHELIEDDDELYLNIHVRGYLTISIAGQKFQPPQNLPYIHAIMPTSSTQDQFKLLYFLGLQNLAK
jgi:hypothetical protein